jgi:hypothetical protein
MIGRIWHGWTTQENADEYQRLLERDVLPGIESRARGYEGIYVLVGTRATMWRSSP